MMNLKNKIMEVLVRAAHPFVKYSANIFFNSTISWFVILLLSFSGMAKGPLDNSNKKFHHTAQINTFINHPNQTASRLTEAGLIVVKFKSPLSDHSPAATVLSDHLVNRYSIQRVEPAFPFLQQTAHKKAVSLSRIYYLHYNSTQDPETLAGEIASDPSIEYAEPKYIYPLLEIPNDPQYPNMTQFPFIQADTAWGLIKGEQGNVVIAIVDGGTDWNHPDLLGNVWTNPGEIPGNGIDDDGNGFVDDIHGWNFPIILIIQQAIPPLRKALRTVLMWQE